MIDPKQLRRLLEQVQDGSTAVETALLKLRTPPVEHLGFARPDHQRSLRCGFPEVVLCQGKLPDDIAQITRALLEHSDRLMLTRADAAAFRAAPRQTARIRTDLPRLDA